MANDLYSWSAQTADALDLPAWAGDRDTVQTILDLARDAAHRVARPAAPVTTFLAGYALGRGEAGERADLEAIVAAIVAGLPPEAD